MFETHTTDLWQTTMARDPARFPHLFLHSPRLVTMLAAIALAFFATGALPASTIVQDAKGAATARVNFKIVIPAVVIVDKDGTVRSNDRRKLMPIAAVPALARANAHTVAALP